MIGHIVGAVCRFAAILWLRYTYTIDRQTAVVSAWETWDDATTRPLSSAVQSTCLTHRGS